MRSAHPLVERIKRLENLKGTLLFLIGQRVPDGDGIGVIGHVCHCHDFLA